jgi:hypothetical protein
MRLSLLMLMLLLLVMVVERMGLVLLLLLLLLLKRHELRLYREQLLRSTREQVRIEQNWI